MIEQEATVVRIDGDTAEVTTRRQSSCGSCSAKGGCGTSLIEAWFPQRVSRFRLKNDIGAHVGDTVVVGLDESKLRRGSLLLYALPLAGLILGAVLGEYLAQRSGHPSELGAVVFGLLGLSAALLQVRRVTSGLASQGDNGLRLVRVLRRSIGISPGDIARPKA